MTARTAHPATPPAGESKTRARVALLLAMLIPALIAAHPLANNDLPMHLAVGDWVQQNGKVPSNDPFSATGHGGSWVAHEWLAATLFKWVEMLGNPNYLIAFAVLLSAKLGMLLELIQRSFAIPAFWRIILLVPLWLAVGRRLMLRPHLLALNAVLTVWWLTRLGRHSPKWLWALIPVMMFWANIHGSFLLGVAFIIGDLCIFSAGHQLSQKRRVGIAVGCVLATLVNPHGLSLYLFPFQLALDPVFTAGVFEWMTPWSAPGFLITPAAICGCVLFVVAILGITLQTLGFGRSGLRELLKKPGLPMALLAASTATVMAFMQLRHMALASLLATPMIGVLWADLRWRVPHRLERLAPGFPLILIGILCTWGYPAGVDARGNWLWRSLGGGWSTQTPIIPLDALVRHWEVEGVLLCEYEFGGFASYVSAGKLRPTMDSRNTVYTADFFLAHEAALRGEDQKTLKALVDQAAAILIHPGKPGRASLESSLIDSSQWALISNAPRIQLWVRRSAVPEKYRNSLPKQK